jgi:glucosamine 6-phosphate synthetase-like amidotransferase/phosphosugar isomerase protein
MTLSQLEKGGYPHFMLKEILSSRTPKGMYARPRECGA